MLQLQVFDLVACGGQTLTQGQSCLQRNCVRQVLSNVVEKHLQGESGWDQGLRQVVDAEARNPVASRDSAGEDRIGRLEPTASVLGQWSLLCLKFCLRSSPI